VETLISPEMCRATCAFGENLDPGAPESFRVAIQNLESGCELWRPENSSQADGGFRRHARGHCGDGRDALPQPDGIEGSVERTEQAYESLRAADTAAFRLTRQENSLRGFLLSGDDYYVKRLEEAHKPKFLAALDDLRKLAKGDQADLARIADVDAAYANYRTEAIEPGESLGRDPLTRPQAVELVKHDGVADKAVEPVENAIEAITKDAEAVLTTEAAAQKKASLESTLALMIGI
jgi:CHASE3 domain sensor protein